jgi:phenylpyruvate tautomerase PptA (4-oxalocrotonate tautomerase family)
VPFVRISLLAGKPDAQVRAIADGVHQAMVEAIDVPPADRFLVIHEVAASRLIADPSYLGVARSAGVVLIEISLHRGRSDEKKQALHRRIADLLAATGGVRAEDVLVVLHDTGSADWSFGNGEAQMLGVGFRPHWAGS